MGRPWALTLVLLAVTSFTASVPAFASTDDQGRWIGLPPPFRTGHSAIYDSLHHRMILLGGSGGGDVVLDLTGSGAWFPLVATGPGPATTSGSSAVLDRVHHRVLLVGGDSAPGLWALSLDEPLQWTRLSTTVPPLEQPCLVYDEVRDRLVAYDGKPDWEPFPPYAGLILSLSLASPTGWTARPIFRDRGPANRAGASVVYDSRRHEMVVLGGHDTGGYPTDDVWSVSLDDDTTWIERYPLRSLVGGVYDAGAVYDELEDRVLVAGGLDLYFAPPLPTASLVSIPLSGGSPTAIPTGGRGTSVGGGTFSGASGGSLVLDTRTRRVIFHGGKDTFDRLSGTWAVSLDDAWDWRSIGPAGPSPSPRCRMDAVFDPSAGQLISFGGYAGYCLDWYCDRHAYADVNVYGPQGWVALDIPPGPAGRYEHSTVLDGARGRALVFGGRDGDVWFGDVWALSLPSTGVAAWTRLDAAGVPPPRSNHLACLDAARDRMLVVGGVDANGARTDVWQLSLTESPEWTALTPGGSPPAAADRVVGVLDPLRHRLLTIRILLGSGAPVAEVKALELEGDAVWTDVPTTGVIPSIDVVRAVYDPLRDRVLVIDVNSSRIASLALDGTPTWSALAPEGPTPGQWGVRAVVFDPRLDRVLTFGGGGAFGVYFADVWALQFGSSYVDAGAPPPPARLALVSLGPNPARGHVRMRLDVPLAADVRVEVFDLAGRRVATPLARRLLAGRHEVGWDTSDHRGGASTGVFLVRACAGREVTTAKVVLVR